MITFKESADASLIYREGTSLPLAQMNSSAAYGNLADAMKNALMITTATFVPALGDQPIELLELGASIER